jgi:hypothetical protein
MAPWIQIRLWISGSSYVKINVEGRDLLWSVEFSEKDDKFRFFFTLELELLLARQCQVGFLMNFFTVHLDFHLQIQWNNEMKI